MDRYPHRPKCTPYKWSEHLLTTVSERVHLISSFCNVHHSASFCEKSARYYAIIVSCDITYDFLWLITELSLSMRCISIVYIVNTILTINNDYTRIWSETGDRHYCLQWNINRLIEINEIQINSAKLKSSI